jgi:hypothetical protein
LKPSAAAHYGKRGKAGRGLLEAPHGYLTIIYPLTHYPLQKPWYLNIYPLLSSIFNKRTKKWVKWSLEAHRNKHRGKRTTSAAAREARQAKVYWRRLTAI